MKKPPCTKVKTYYFRLYVTGATARSTRAITNLRILCERHLHGNYELEVIDLYKHPEKAGSEQILAAPTLVKHLPLPLRRFIGDLSDTQHLLINLGISSKPATQVHQDGYGG